MESFDPAHHFDTPKELLGRTFNRPRQSTLQTLADQGTNGNYLLFTPDTVDPVRWFIFIYQNKVIENGEGKNQTIR